MIQAAIKVRNELGPEAIFRSHRIGFRIWFTAHSQPSVIQQTASVDSAVYEGILTIESHTAGKRQTPLRSLTS